MEKRLIPISIFLISWLFLSIQEAKALHPVFNPPIFSKSDSTISSALPPTAKVLPTAGPPFPGRQSLADGGSTFDLVFPQAVQVNPNTVYIPFRMVGRLIAVQARVDTNAGIFFLDTGAERLLLNSNYFEPERGWREVTTAGTTGSVESVFYNRVDTLYWDELRFPKQQANILDLSHIERKKNIRLIGIIGYEVLKEYEVFLDYQLKQIILTRLDKDGYRIDSAAIWEQPYDSLDFKLAGHLIVLDGEVQGQKLRFALDSGAELNLLDRKVKRRVLDNFEIIKRVNMVGAGQKTIEVLAGTLYRVKCGNQNSSGMRTLLTNLDEMGENFGVRLDGFLGYEFLYTRRTLINYKRKKLFFFKQHRP